MPELHVLLKRQLKKYFGSAENAPPELLGFISAVNEAYQNSDSDRILLERSYDISTQEMTESSSLLKATLESITDGILVVDLADKVVAYNHRFLELWKIPEELIVSRDDKKLLEFIFIQLSSPEEFMLKVQELYANPEEHSFDVINFKDGRIFERFSRPQKVGDKVTGRVWSFRDISQRKEIESSLEQSKNYLKTIFDSVQAGLLIIDPYTCTIVDVNPVVVKLFGLPKDQIVGRSCHKFICPTEEKKCPIVDLGQRVDNSERILLKSNGEEVPILKTVVPVSLNNKKYLLESFVDISERKKKDEERELLIKELEEQHEQLKQTQGQLIQAEKLNTIGRLASGVAHEVKNPLGIILQAVNYLERSISTEDKEIQETLVLLKENVRRADNIINSLLDFSRATTAELLPEEINAILEASLRLVKARYKFGSIETSFEIKQGLPKIMADKNKLEQVFINILANAFQAMPDGGKLQIRAYADTFNQYRSGVGRRKDDVFSIGETAVIVEVQDTGKGISEEHLKKVFDPFFTTKGHSSGIGLGLSVTRNIIALHKGFIDIKSKLGEGTTVTVILKTAK